VTQGIAVTTHTRRRLVLDLPADVYDGLRELATANYRDGKREAIRLLTEGVERELKPAVKR
jgi:hypothetical protein